MFFLNFLKILTPRHGLQVLYKFQKKHKINLFTRIHRNDGLDPLLGPRKRRLHNPNRTRQQFNNGNADPRLRLQNQLGQENRRSRSLSPLLQTV